MDKQVMMALRRNLWQVGYRQDLPAFAQTPQQLTDDLGSGATDSHVDFVEHQCRDARGLRGNHLDSQADA
ncbi:hypothetical protein D3C78_1260230 [compost metagenome]